MYDTVIIGGGVVGAAIARELSRYHLQVALLEKEEELAFGVSKSNSGIIHPGTQNPPGSLKGKLCVRGNVLIRRIARELGVDFKQVGELIVAFSDEEKSRLIELKREAEGLGVPGLRIVGRWWLKRHEPNLSPHVVAALCAPTAGIISPYRLVYDLSENARRNGAAIHTRTLVTSIDVLSGQPRFRVQTSSGPWETQYVINAAGLFADDIARMVGVNDFVIRPRRGQEFLLDKKREFMTRHLIFPLPTKTSKGVLIIKTADGNPMIGPTAEDLGDKNDLATTDEGLFQVLASARRMVPAINGKDIIAYFAGLRPAAGDDFIIREEKRVPGFINVAGIQSPGLTAAPAIAEMVVDILKNAGLPLRKKNFFHGQRQQTMHLFSMRRPQMKKMVKKDSGYGDIVCRCEMVSAKEIEDAIDRGAVTLDGIKFRTRAQAGRCHGGFCTTRLMKILSEKTGQPLTAISKRGPGSEIVKKDRDHAGA